MHVLTEDGRVVDILEEARDFVYQPHTRQEWRDAILGCEAKSYSTEIPLVDYLLTYCPHYSTLRGVRCAETRAQNRGALPTYSGFRRRDLQGLHWRPW